MMLPQLMSAVLLGLMWTDPSAPAPAETFRPAPDGEASVLVAYDITGLTQGPVENRRAVRMFPFTRTSGESFGAERPELGDVIESLVYEVVAPEAFEYEGRSLQRMDDGRLLVVAPPALQERIAQLIEGFRAGFGRTARIALEVYAVAPGRAFPTVVDQEEIAKMVNSGLLRLVHRRQDQVRIGCTERIEALDSTTIIEDWDGEIAQNAAIPAPDLRELDTGVDLLVRVEDVPGSSAVRVRQALAVSELRDLGTRELAIYNGVRLDNSIHNDESREAQDLPIVSSSSTVGSFVLEVGDGVVSLGHTSTLAGGASWLTNLKVLEVDPLPAPLQFDGRAVAILDGSAASWPAFEAPRIPAARLAGRSGHLDGDRIYGLTEMGDEEDTPWFPADESIEWEGAFLECQAGLLSSEADVDVWDGLWTWTHTPWVVWAAPSDQMARNMAMWPRFVAERKNLIVELGINEVSGPGGTSREVARGRLCMESGGTGFMMFGDVVMLSRGYDVDVATGAVITQPRTAPVFDGLYVRAAASGPGQTVDVTISSSQLRELSDVSLSALAPASLARPSFSLSDTSARVPADGQRRVIAELDGSFDGDRSRALWVSVHAR